MQYNTIGSVAHSYEILDAIRVILSFLKISKIRVAQTSELPGLGCHIAEISVKSSGSAVPTVFHCYSWFDKAHDDGLTEREFAPAVTASEDIAKDGTAKEKNEQAKNR